jgi:hypothetical protein
MKKSEQFPSIREFVRGYLHEDARVEYGSAEGAAKAWIEDAGAAARKKIKAEWAKFASANKTIESVNSALAKLGAKWEFAKIDDFQKMTDFF